jgi:hypothetical protein
MNNESRREVSTLRASAITSTRPGLELLNPKLVFELRGSGRCPKSTMSRRKLMRSMTNSDGASE